MSSELYNELKEWEITHDDIVEALHHLSYSQFLVDDLGAILVRWIDEKMLAIDAEADDENSCRVFRVALEDCYETPNYYCARKSRYRR